MNPHSTMVTSFPIYHSPTDDDLTTSPHIHVTRDSIVTVVVVFSLHDGSLRSWKGARGCWWSGERGASGVAFSSIPQAPPPSPSSSARERRRRARDSPIGLLFCLLCFGRPLLCCARAARYPFAVQRDGERDAAAANLAAHEGSAMAAVEALLCSLPVATEVDPTVVAHPEATERRHADVRVGEHEAAAARPKAARDDGAMGAVGALLLRSPPGRPRRPSCGLGVDPRLSPPPKETPARPATGLELLESAGFWVDSGLSLPARAGYDVRADVMR